MAIQPDSPDLVAEAFTLLSPAQKASLADQAQAQADKLRESGQVSFSLLWRSLALTARRSARNV